MSFPLPRAAPCPPLSAAQPPPRFPRSTKSPLKTARGQSELPGLATAPLPGFAWEASALGTSPAVFEGGGSPSSSLEEEKSPLCGLEAPRSFHIFFSGGNSTLCWETHLFRKPPCRRTAPLFSVGEGGDNPRQEPSFLGFTFPCRGGVKAEIK